MADAPSPRPGRRLRDIPGTLFVLGLCVAWGLRCEWAGDTTKVDDLVLFGAIERSRTWDGEPWRLLSAMFLHVGLIHLVVNLWGMWELCRTVERWLGTAGFLAAYLLSGILGNALSLLGHDSVSAGASGAGFGMIGVVLSAHRHVLGSWRDFFASPSVRRILAMIAIWTALGIVALPMNHWAHGGGLLGGFLAAVPLLAWRASPRKLRLGIAALVLLVAAAGAAGVHRWPGQRARWGAARAFQEGVDAFDRDPATALRAFTRAGEFAGPDGAIAANRAILQARLGDPEGSRRTAREALARPGLDPALRAKLEALSGSP